MFFNTSLVLATPTGADIAAGAASLGQAGNITTVTMNSPKAVINWDSLNTASNETLQFIKASGNFSVLNRVVQGGATQFDGKLLGNQGNIFIVNPRGVVFGPTAFVQAQQFVASSLDITNEDFMNGILQFSGDAVGTIANYGKISGKQVALIGKQIFNAGEIVSQDGYVILASGDSVFLGEQGSDIVVQIESVTLPADGTTQGLGNITNEGLIEGVDGTVILAAGDIFVRALDGLSTLSTTVDSGIGKVIQSGTISADGSTGNAGTVIVAASDEVVLNDGSVTKANAAANGDGGDTLILADNMINFAEGASVQAKGGSESGDGGFIEISSDHFILDGDYDATAPNGKAGKFQIDPEIVTIRNGSGSNTEDVIYETWLESQLQGGEDVDIFADYQIIVEHLKGNGQDHGLEGGTGDITLRNIYDTGSIVFLPEYEGDPITTTLSTTNGNIYMLAGKGGILAGNIVCDSRSVGGNPGSIRLFTNNDGSIETGYLDVLGGNYVEISVISSGDLVMHGDLTTHTNKVPDQDDKTGRAQICLAANGLINVEGDLDAEAHGKEHTYTSIHVDAGDRVTVTGDIDAKAETSGQDLGDGISAEAIVKVHTAASDVKDGQGNITEEAIDIQGDVSVRAKIKGANEFTFSAPGDAGDDTNNKNLESDDAAYNNDDELVQGNHAQIEIENEYDVDGCPDCPRPNIEPPQPPPNLEPIGIPDSETIHMNDPVSGNVLLNDNDPDGDPLNATLVDDVDNGTLTLNSDGTYSYQPDTGFTGTDTFTYTASDGTDATDPILVTITINNDLPVADDFTSSIHMNDSTGGDIDNYITEPDGDLYQITLVDDVDNGTLTLNPDGTYSYQPNPGFTGTDTFTYSASDGEIGATPDQGLITITINNDLPVADDFTSSIHMNDSTGGDIDNYITEPDGDLYQITLVDDVDNGTLTLNPDGTYNYQPDPGFTGTDTFTYLASDGEIGATFDQGIITILVGNNLPVAVNDSASTLEGNPVVINILGNDFDPDNDLFQAILLSGPTNGSLTLNADGTYTYTPNPGFTGSDEFTYFNIDGQIGAEPDSAVVTITVTALPPEPEPQVIPVPPLPVFEIPEIGGCPALMQWLAAELGVSAQDVQIYISGTYASSSYIEPCQMCGNLKNSAMILQDTDGARLAALAQIINEIATPGTPPSEEQMILIVSTISQQVDDEDQPHYASAGEYLDALASYVGILNNDLGISEPEVLTMVMDKYGTAIAQSGDAALVSFIEARLSGLGG
jgi:filamentous hemagglutinin family protein